MTKKTVFVCQQCGYESAKWLGKCPSCNSWASMVEYKDAPVKRRGTSRASPKKPQKLSEVPKNRLSRIITGIDELDLVLGGGLVPGQVVLVAGEPGIGKSTLVLELANKVTPALYISGEESISQIKLRADRMGAKSPDVHFLEETDMDVILESLEKESRNTEYKVIIIDSVQTMYTNDLPSIAGSVGQVREAALRAITYAKRTGTPVILIGHVTKDGTVAGPSTLAHMVDSVLWFEGDKLSALRILRSVKNRFGGTDEVGIFQMTADGLKGTSGTEALFLGEVGSVAGSAISVMVEGTRPILIEIQALVVPTKLAFPRRVVHGIDSKKVELIIAVLSRHCGLNLAERDVFVNVTGGIKVKDPGVDLAIALAIASSYKNKPLKKKTFAVGELGLLGEVRSTKLEEQRLARAKRQGFTNAITAAAFSRVSEAIKVNLK